MKFLVITVILITHFDNGVCKKKYDNYTLFRSMPLTENHVEFLKSLPDLYDVNYWREPGMISKPVEFIIHPKHRPYFLKAAEEMSMPVTTLMNNVQRALDKQSVKAYTRRKMETFDWSSFYRIKDINNWLRDLAKSNSRVVQLNRVGRTVERREILGVRILFPRSKRRSTVIIEGGIHAREWISPAFVTYMIDQILRAPDGDDEKLKEIAMTYEWYFIPCLNPDGYEYTHEQDRMWRKNRRSSHGVDLNRNFGVAFGGVGTSTSLTSETYAGTESFSEPEASSYAQFLKTKSQRLEYYLAFHAYGQYMIIPYAYSKGHWDNYDVVQNMALEAARAISRRHNTKYEVGTAYDTVGYLSSGASGCWAKQAYDIPYVITFELPDQGEHGFALPAQRIKPTCQETIEGMISFLTPRTKHFDKEVQFGPADSACDIILETSVLMFDIMLFIIVRFD